MLNISENNYLSKNLESLYRYLCVCLHKHCDIPKQRNFFPFLYSILILPFLYRDGLCKFKKKKSSLSDPSRDEFNPLSSPPFFHLGVVSKSSSLIHKVWKKLTKVQFKEAAARLCLDLISKAKINGVFCVKQFLIESGLEWYTIVQWDVKCFRKIDFCFWDNKSNNCRHIFFNALFFPF